MPSGMRVGGGMPLRLWQESLEGYGECNRSGSNDPSTHNCYLTNTIARVATKPSALILQKYVPLPSLLPSKVIT